LCAEQNVFGPLDITELNCKYLVNYPQDCLKCGGYSVFSLNSSIAVKNLLKNLGICHQAFTIRNAALKKSLGINLVRVLGADEIHRYI